MERARIDFRDLVGQATPADLRRRSNGTRWTNRQLLFHMLFGYLIVRTLMPLVHAFGKRPASWSRRFAAILNACQRPFHLINYLGSCGGGQLLPTSTMIKLMDRTIHSRAGRCRVICCCGAGAGSRSAVCSGGRRTGARRFCGCQGGVRQTAASQPNDVGAQAGKAQAGLFARAAVLDPQSTLAAANGSDDLNSSSLPPTSR
jgi:hypothetical protein